MRTKSKSTAVALMVGLLAAGAQAQQSATSDLDSCINSEKLSLTTQGAVAGAAAGLLGTLLAGKKKDAGKGALVGAVAGGALGFATAYYKAAGTCMQRNPAWVPESNLTRNPNYRATVSEFKYKPAQGDLAIVRPLQNPATVHQGETASFQARFVVLTPDGGEAKVRIVRKLFVIADGQESEVPFPGKATEDRVVENGEQTDEFKLLLDKEVPVGTKLRVQYAISLKDAQFVPQSGIVEVK
jgi:hypothetical protein